MDFKSAVTIMVRLLLALASFVLILRLLENKFVFYPGKVSPSTSLPPIPGARVENEWLYTADDVRLNAWWLIPENSPSPAPTLLYLHGNAGSLFDRAGRLTQFASHGWQILALDYRGYGWSEGRPNEAGLYQDAAAAYDFLIHKKRLDPNTIIFYGESLGTAVALQLALEHRCAGLILEAPFTSFADMGKSALPWLPRFLFHLLSNEWNSAARVTQINSPKLILHGDHDAVVPFAQGRRLYELAQLPKLFFPVAGAGHGDCLELGGGDLSDRMQQFVIEALQSASRFR